MSREDSKTALILRDGGRYRRESRFWLDRLGELSPGIIGRCSYLSPTDRLVLNRINVSQVLIFNFDSINDDPFFGSDKALAFVRLQHMWLLNDWVAKGGLLIVEGQTMHNVPKPESYDALFGQRELYVSGEPENRGNSDFKWHATGNVCRVSPCACEDGLLPQLGPIKSASDMPLESYFPGGAIEILGVNDQDKLKWNGLLYRGWFLPALEQKPKYSWIPLIETDREGSNYPVLMGARVGRGAIFVSTMFLAGTGQSRLIEHLIQLGSPDSPLKDQPPRPSMPTFDSVFISYSSKDKKFAEHLHNRLCDEGVVCWLAGHDIEPGRKMHEQIRSAIDQHRRILVILSHNSMKSEWVWTEIAMARQREAAQQKELLFPIRLVEYEAIKAWENFDADRGKDSAREIREYFIPDFSNWENRESFERAFAQVLRALQTTKVHTAAAQ